MHPNKDLATTGPVAPSPASDGPRKLSPAEESVVGDLIASLDRRRLYREVTLALRSGLRDSSADFSFLRLRGLRNLLKSLKSIANSDAAIGLFCDSQTIPQLQGIIIIIIIFHLISNCFEYSFVLIDWLLLVGKIVIKHVTGLEK